MSSKADLPELFRPIMTLIGLMQSKPAKSSLKHLFRRILTLSSAVGASGFSGIVFVLQIMLHHDR